MKFNFNTKCVHGNKEKVLTDNTGAISYPIYQTATFSHPGVGQSTGYDYSRAGNPTRDHLEKVIASLEYGKEAMAFSSGMAATNALMELFSPGDHIVASEDLYGGTIRIFNNINKKNGLNISYTDTSHINNIENLITNDTKAIYIETPTNPMMNITDIKAVSKIAKANGLILIVDNTFLSPYFQNPLLLGADIVLHSGTKFLSGHNDTLAGFLITSNDEIGEKIRYISKTTGAGLSPFDSWLVLRGLKTLALRMDRQQENAKAIADWLSKHNKVEKVYYMDLASHPGYEINKRQASGCGAMISFHVYEESTAVKLLENLKVIQYAESLGGVESLITYPMLQTHADIPFEEREAKKINKYLLRLSVGIEDIEDLLKDLEDAMTD